MNKSINYKKTLSLLLLLCFGIYVLIKIINGFRQNAEALAEDLPSTHELSSKDSSLIAAEYFQGLEVNEVLHSKARGPISLMTLEKKYSLILYTIKMESIEELGKILHLEKRSVDRSTGYTYSVINSGSFRFQYKSGTTPLAKNIYLTLSGDSIISLSKNDSIVSFHLLCDNMSLRYGKSDPVDIFFEANKKFLSRQKVPVDILFYKNNDGVNMFVMVSNSRGDTISPNYLLRIVPDKQSTHQ